MLRTLICIIPLLAVFCRADLYVITHQDNRVNKLTLDQVKELYLARNQSLPSGEKAIIYERRDTELRSRFIGSALGMRVRQFDAYWARLIFAGRVLPLNIAGKENELYDYLLDSINAIGYTDQPPESSKFKTLLLIRE